MPSNNPKALIIPIVVVVAIVGVIAVAIYFSSGPDEETADGNGLVYDNLLAEAVTDDDWSKGATDPRVTIVKYTDFECPACGFAHANILSEILKAHPDDVRIVYRHFPLSNHKQAQKAAEAAEAAGAQGQFWEMVDLIYQGQEDLSVDQLKSFAEELGLDVERFAKELEDGIHVDAVKWDKDSGDRSGVNATPSFYINGEKYVGKINFDEFKAAIETHLP